MCIRDRNRVAGDERKAITEALLRMADVPAHGTAHEQRHERVHLGAGTARVPALAVVQHQIDVLIRAILDLFPVMEVPGLRAVCALQVEFLFDSHADIPVSYTHLRAHETPE